LNDERRMEKARKNRNLGEQRQLKNRLVEPEKYQFNHWHGYIICICPQEYIHKK
jgi:hypothetical protein